MDFQSAMETFAEAWVAANAGQQTQALALTRSKSPSTSSLDISVKKELSLSPPHHQQFQQHQQQPSAAAAAAAAVAVAQQMQQSQLQIARDTQSASSASLSSGGGGGGGAGTDGSSGNGAAGQSLEKNQSSMYSMKHHLNQIAQAQQQQQQQNHQNQSQSLDHETPSPHHYTRRSTEASPVPQMNDHVAAAMASSHSAGGGGSGLRPLAMSNLPKIETPTPSSENGPSGGSKSGSMLGAGVIGNEKMKRSPSVEPRDFDMGKDRVKLHCIVESVHSSQASLLNDTKNAYKRRPNIESDCWVDVGTATLWKDIVNTVLQNLGYSLEVASTARGSLIVKNWKPIPFENISDSPVVQVGDILGELASFVTLRILILRAKSSPFGEIKDKLLRLLVLQSHAVLRSTGCPLDEVILSQICRSSYQSSYDYTGEISDDLRRKFDQWWSNQLSPQSPIAPKMLPFMAAAAAAGAPHQSSGMDFSTVGQMAAAAAAARSLHHTTNRDNLLGDGHQPPPPPPHHLHPSMIVHPVMHPHPMHPHHASYPTNQKTRMRTSFDPEMELPKLQKWFQENPHPSRQQIQTYVMQLNSLESRRGRKPLDVNNVVYWFKNARAAQKRAEMRGGVGPMPVSGIGSGAGGPLGAGHAANGYLNHHHAQHLISHEYLKSPMSLKSEDIDTMSQHSDDMDDDQSRPISPQLPLSLTMHERNRSPEDGGSSMGKDDVTSNHNGSMVERSSSRSAAAAAGERAEDLPNGNADRDRHSDVETHSQHGEANNNNNNSSSSNNNNSNSNNNNHSSNRSLDERCESPKEDSPKSDDDLDMDDDNDTSQMEGYGSPSPDPRKNDIFSMVPNAMFPQSLMYMSHYMPGFGQPGHPHHAGGGMHPAVPMGPGGLNLSNLSSEERRKRNRTFIDPVTEVPKLEHWFSLQTHPSHNMILKYTEDLNTMPYRQKFPRLESKNVQFWFKNRRAKCKRLKMSLYDSPQCAQLGGMNSFVHKYDERD